ncbi:MAG TPA: HEAT repeat domain-containing protein, partial [Gemmataceae bacterium]|nr:HEAT repeat domain-containing protein [Gemmataceae bacterium]
EAVRQAAPGVLIHLGARAAPAVPALIKAVQARRVLAAMALGAIGPAAKDAVPALRQALADKKTTTDLIGNADPALSRLGITKPSLAGAAAAALEQIGPAAEPAIPELIATLKHPQADARYQAAHALGRLASDAPEVPPALARVMRDDKEDPLIRAEAIEALGQLGKAALPSLIDGLKLRLADLRAAAARNLGRIAPLPPEAIKALAHVLADPEPAVRMASARVLSQAADQALPTIGELERALLMKGQTAEVVDALAQALANLGDKGSAVLLKGLSAQSPAVRRGCARALGMTASLPTGAIHALTEAVNDTDEGVRVAAAEALGRLGPDAKAALPVLKQHADKDPSATVRQAAADAVARIVPS